MCWSMVFKGASMAIFLDCLLTLEPERNRVEPSTKQIAIYNSESKLNACFHADSLFS